MMTLAKLSIRRPKSALLVWLITGIALSAIGFGVSKTLSPSVTIVPNTQSSKAEKLANAQFGPSQLVPILLQGPKAQLDLQGPKLVAALAQRPKTRVLSAWDTGPGSTGLRPSATSAMIVASIDGTEKHAVKYDQPQIEKLVSRQVSTPVKAYISGQPSVDQALKDASINDLRSSELIAVGILFVLLLIGLRAPVAALIVTAIGAVSMLASFGESALLGKFMGLEAIGVPGGAMAGLALGVGFSLLVLDRFHREEYPPGAPPREVASAAMRGLETTGRAVLIGGTAVVVGLLLVAAVGPYDLMVSVGTAATVAAMFAIGGSVVVLPAAMALLGRRMDWLKFPAPAILARGWSGLVGAGGWVTRHAVYTGFAATVLLVVIAWPAQALKTGQPSVQQLPKDSTARIAFEHISQAMGPGWATPFDMILVSDNGPITDPKLLSKVDAMQRQIARNPSVASVSGPGQINASAKQLKQFWPGLAKSIKISKQSKKDLLKLIDGLGQAGTGSQQLRTGLEQAVSGANQLHGGAGQAQVGAAALHGGLAQAQSGSTQLSAGLNQALSGAEALKTGAGQALTGASQIATGTKLAQSPAAQSLPAIGSLKSAAASTNAKVGAATGSAGTAVSDAGAALSALRSLPASAQSDPAYGRAISAIQGALSAANTTKATIGGAASSASGALMLASGLEAQAPGLLAAINMLHDGAGQLASGIQQLQSGNGQLASGISQLANGGGQLKGGLGLLTAGAGQLEAGLVLLDNGTGQLASGLAAGPNGAGQLVTGLGVMQAAVIKARGQVPSTADLEKLHKQSPGMFSNGYFVLSAVAGAGKADRTAASFTLNLLRGGNAGQIVVISKYASGDKRTESLRTQLVSTSQAFAKANHAQVAIGGPGGGYADWTSQAKDRIWIDVAVLAAALALVLALALRSIVLPAVAILFNLLTTAAAFGVMQVLFGAPSSAWKTLFGGSQSPVLGGPGYMDPVSIISVFTLAFAVSAVFSTLLLARTREAYVEEGVPRRAVLVGLRETAAAATGAGILMVAALIPFSTSELINVRQLGVGVGVSILLSVLLFRPVLLPAAEAVLGRVGWWPTRAPAAPAAGGPDARPKRRHVPRLHVPHRHPRPAHQ